MDPPRLTSIYANANAVAPNRRKSSDGTLGDAAHRASGGDHNPDSRGVVHAIDISQSMPGTPYWEPRFQQFDSFSYARRIVAQYVAASPAVRASRWPWLADGGYLVWYEAGRGVDVIFNPSVSLTVRQNGAAKTEHNQHVHHSIGHTVRSEQDTQPIFTSATPAPEEDIEMTEAELRTMLGYTASNGARVPGLLDEAIQHQFGGYKSGKWTPAELLRAARAKLNIADTD